MKNLLGRLMSRPFDELKSIAATWGTLTRDKDPTHNDLAIAVFHTMVDRSAMRGTWENLDLEARQFIEWLLRQRNMLAILDDLPAHLDRPPEEVAPIIERVRRVGFADVDEVLVRGSRVVSSGDNLYSWASRNQPEAVRRRVVSVAAEAARVLSTIIEENKRPVPVDESLADLLDHLEQEEIQRIASMWRLPEAHRYYKAELINVMTEFLGTAQTREALLLSLPQVSQDLFAYLGSQGGNATAAAVRKRFGWDEREFRAALLPLLQRVIVWDVLSDDRHHLFVPRDLLKGDQALPSPLAARMQPKLESSAPYSSESRHPYEMAWDILTLLAAGERQELSVTLQEGRITKRVAKRLNDTLLHPIDLRAGTDYIDMLVHMTQVLGLLEERRDEPPAFVPTLRVNEWAKLSFAAQTRRLFGLWQEDRKWVEPATYGTIYWWNSDLTGARKRLIRHIAALPVGQWISVEGFLRKVHLAEPFIIWPQDELVRRFGLRALQGFRSHWFEIEGRILADMLRTMLHWLGAVDLGRDKAKRFVSFQLTGQGKDLLDQSSAEANAPALATMHGSSRSAPAALLVQPNFEVLVLQPESEVVWNLLRMADLVRHDRVSVYALNKESVLRGVEAGLSPEEMVYFLQANAGKSLPQNVSHSVVDWAGMLRRIDILRATLIEVDEPSLLDEMLASRKTRRYITRRLSPTVALANVPRISDSARSDSWTRLIKELKSAGYTPRLLDDTISSGQNDTDQVETREGITALPTATNLTTTSSRASQGTAVKASRTTGGRRRATNRAAKTTSSPARPTLSPSEGKTGTN